MKSVWTNVDHCRAGSMSKGKSLLMYNVCYKTTLKHKDALFSKLKYKLLSNSYLQIETLNVLHIFWKFKNTNSNFVYIFCRFLIIISFEARLCVNTSFHCCICKLQNGSVAQFKSCFLFNNNNFVTKFKTSKLLL